MSVDGMDNPRRGWRKGMGALNGVRRGRSETEEFVYHERDREREGWGGGHNGGGDDAYGMSCLVDEDTARRWIGGKEIQMADLDCNSP